MPTNSARVSTQAAIGTPVAVIVVFILGHFGIAVPAEVTAAIAALLTVLVGAFGPDAD